LAERSVGWPFDLEKEADLGQGQEMSRTHRSRSSGFSTIELAVSLGVLLILTGAAIPTIMRSVRIYQLNDAAARLSDMLKFTRFEAVRRNKQINFQMQKDVSNWLIWTDVDGDGVADPNEKQLVIGGIVTLLPSGAPPSAAPILAALNASSLTTLSGRNGSVTFDARGAIRAGGAVSSLVYVFYLGNSAHPDFGYRAVVLVPSGGTQIWSAPAGGPWQRIG
jgi:type II secretory pathway pseudopilin PulG